MPDTELLDRFDQLATELNEDLLERDREIHGLCVALVAGTHMFMLGSPGVAKSGLIDGATRRIAKSRLFKCPMHRLLTMDDLFGPVDLAGYEQSRYGRFFQHYLPWADLFYANEIWNAGPAVLKSLLGVINEGFWLNDGTICPVPLSTMLCDSNHLPDDPTLAAVFDRIPLRYVTGDIIETSNFIRMLEHEIDEQPEPVMTWDHVTEAKAAAALLPVAPLVLEKTADLRRTLREVGIECSPRRWKKGLQVMRAEAWLDGSDVVAVEHMSILAHVLWEEPGQQAEVADAVLELANPMEKEILELTNDVEGMSKLIDNTVAVAEDSDEHKTRGVEVLNKLAQADKDLKAIIDRSGTGRRQSELIENCRRRLHSHTLRMITEVFKLPADSIEDLNLETLTDTKKSKK